MAPPEKTFPISELENRVHLHDVEYREKSRKLPKGFDLKRDCELHELVQYSCSTQSEIEEQTLLGQRRTPIECFPFVRLFRRCKSGNQEFNVETTAWEGKHKWKPSKRLLDDKAVVQSKPQQSTADEFANYGGYFWSGK